MGKRNVSQHAQDLANVLIADQPRVRKLLSRGTNYLWLKPVTEGPLALLGVTFDIIEAQTYPHQAPQGSTVNLAGVLLASGNAFAQKPVAQA